jgi:hypothetical protein
VRIEKANESEPLMKCRKRTDGIETGEKSLPREEPGDYLPTAQAVSGIKVARARSRLLCGTWEPATSMLRLVGTVPGRARKGDPQVAETARGRVPMRVAGTDRLVVVMKPGNAGGAKGAGCPGLLVGQPPGGRSR